MQVFKDAVSNCKDWVDSAKVLNFDPAETAAARQALAAVRALYDSADEIIAALTDEENATERAFDLVEREHWHEGTRTLDNAREAAMAAERFCEKTLRDTIIAACDRYAEIRSKVSALIVEELPLYEYE